MTVLALVASLMLARTVSGAPVQSQWLITPGRAVGPVRLGMSPTQVASALGQASRYVSDNDWIYERPLKCRVEFQDGKAFRITTWDKRAATASGIQVGSLQATVVDRLGGNPQTIPGRSGTWLYSRVLGLAVFVESRAGASAFVVMAPGSPVASRPAPPGTATP
jgi:hypothetical protein